ncbi:MAG: winged helix-turn-helix transcriptional regulator [Thermoplasmatales archaeon]|nr:MAG: winged helix-turn-helix transcriptional regulator [Thermoplasmatales archaeon]
MSKVTLDMNTFKALASETRLDILRALDGKKMALKDISKITKLNKATLHEHLIKLNEAGLVKKKEREGHKWVYYKLTWKGECLLHPDNTRIVVLFSTTFVFLFFGIISLVDYVKGKIIAFANVLPGSDTTSLFAAEEVEGIISPSLSFSVGDTFRNVANVPTQNQTIDTLSQILNENATSQGVWKVARTGSELKWTAADDACSGNFTQILNDLQYNMTKIDLEAGEEFFSYSDIPTSTIVAIVQDPIFLYIAIGCMVLFTIILSIGIWKFWANKTPKL